MSVVTGLEAGWGILIIKDRDLVERLDTRSFAMSVGGMDVSYGILTSTLINISAPLSLKRQESPIDAVVFDPDLKSAIT